MLPHKKKVTRERRGRLRKIDNMLFQMRHMVKEEKKGTIEEGAAKPAETKDEMAKPVVAPVKKSGIKTIDAKAGMELLQQLRKKLKLPDGKQVTWSYLEYACVYKGIELNDLQKKAVKIALESTLAAKAPE
jgi:hypothetical protein